MLVTPRRVRTLMVRLAGAARAREAPRVRHPWDILDNPEVTRLIDWSEPVAVLAIAILHFITCATFYRTDRDSWIVQGKRRGPRVAAQLVAFGDDETFAEIPAPLVDLFVKKYVGAGRGGRAARGGGGAGGAAGR
jgi:S-adenosyl methyltransferase